MALSYSIYEAKARFSEVIRQVREGKTVPVSYRGEPVAEIRSIRRRQKLTLDEWSPSSSRFSTGEREERRRYR